MNWNKIKVLLFKEIKGVVRDRKTFMMMVIFPLVFLPVLIGGITYFQMKTMQGNMEEIVPVYIEGREYATGLVGYLKSSGDYKIVDQPEKDIAPALQDGEIALYLKIEPAFHQKIIAGNSGEIKLFYNNTNTLSDSSSKRILQLIAGYTAQIVEQRLKGLQLSPYFIEPVKLELVNTATEQEKSGRFLGMMIPYFVIISIFIGAMNIGINITSGEKEKETLSTLLVTQLTRSEIVVGKLLTLIILSTFSAILNIVGIVLAYQFVFSSVGSGMELVIDLSANTLFKLGGLFVLLAFIVSGIIILAGSFARNIKEGNSYVMPIYMVVILIGVLSMSGAFQPAGFIYYLPIVNIIFLLQDIFMLQANLLHLWITIITSLVFGGLISYLSVKLFQREEIIFRT
ncbi:MAG: ABC transporter permease [Halanaerobiales bacterium]|nr:ABC transporter permease [Halanaerobiales bacterium]